MSQIALVNVLHPILTQAGWVAAGENKLPLAEAQSFAKGGHLEILSVDGERHVYQPCCSGESHEQ